MKGAFSSFLLEQVEETLKANKQVILFQNRRGYAQGSCVHVWLDTHVQEM